MISETDIAAYRRDGCVITPGLLNDLYTIIPAIRSHTRRLDPNTLPLDERSTYDRAFTQVMNVWREDAQVEAFIRTGPLAEAAARLMGVCGVRLYHDQALFKEAGGGRTPWHCDQVYWPIDNPNTVTAWFPLQDTPLEMGPLAFACGSADITSGRNVTIGDESDDIIAPLMAECDYLNPPFRLGDVSWHSGWTYHNAGPNLTGQAREAFTIIFIADDARLVEPSTPEKAEDARRWCPGIAPGEIIASDLNPVLWRAS